MSDSLRIDGHAVGDGETSIGVVNEIEGGVRILTGVRNVGIDHMATEVAVAGNNEDKTPGRTELYLSMLRLY